MQAPAQPPADLLPVQRRATLAYRALRLWAVPLLHSLFRITVDGRERIPTDRNYVLIANHLNWLDSFAILATFPIEPRVHFLGDTTILVTRKFQWAPTSACSGAGSSLYTRKATTAPGKAR
jgi:1-acyl-sn-glycerol-3-phosphate acyltransferase